MENGCCAGRLRGPVFLAEIAANHWPLPFPAVWMYFRGECERGVPGVIALAYNLSTQKAEARGSQVSEQPVLERKYWPILSTLVRREKKKEK